MTDLASDQSREFDAVILGDPASGGAWVDIPFDVKAAFGTAGRVPVVATFDTVDYRGSLMVYGGRHRLGIRKDIQAKIGKAIGDTVHVTVTRDAGERTVDIPDDVRGALREAGLLAEFEQLAYTHRREYVTWITTAKRIETRAQRIGKLPDMVRSRRR